MTLALYLVGLALVALGIAGLVVPALPGALFLVLGVVLIAWAEGFERIGWPTIVIAAVLAALMTIVDWVASLLGAKRMGASTWGLVGAGIGLVVGMFFGLPGILLGPFAGAVIGELSLRRSLPEAGRAGIGASVGMALGVAAKLALGFGMVGIYLLARFF